MTNFNNAIYCISCNCFGQWQFPEPFIGKPKIRLRTIFKCQERVVIPVMSPWMQWKVYCMFACMLCHFHSSKRYNSSIFKGLNISIKRNTNTGMTRCERHDFNILLVCLHPHTCTFKLLGYSIFWLWAYMMNYSRNASCAIN